MIISLIMAITDEEERNLALELYEQYRSRIMRMAAKYFRNHQDVEDALSESVVKIIKNIRKFIPLERNEREAFLVCLVDRVCKTKYVKDKKGLALSIDLYSEETGREISDSMDIEDIVINRETIDRARGLLNEIDPQYAEMINLRHFGYSCAEIAEEFDITEGNVRIIFHRLKKKLNEKIGKEAVI